MPPLLASHLSASVGPRTIWESAIEVYPVGIVVVEPFGNIVLANSETGRMFGYAPEEIVGQPVDMLVPTNLQARHAQHRALFAARAEIRMANNRRLCGRRKDGTEFPVEVGLNQIQTSEGIFGSRGDC